MELLFLLVIVIILIIVLMKIEKTESTVEKEAVSKETSMEEGGKEPSRETAAKEEIITDENNADDIEYLKTTDALEILLSEKEFNEVITAVRDIISFSMVLRRKKVLQAYMNVEWNPGHALDFEYMIRRVICNDICECIIRSGYSLHIELNTKRGQIVYCIADFLQLDDADFDYEFSYLNPDVMETMIGVTHQFLEMFNTDLFRVDENKRKNAYNLEYILKLINDNDVQEYTSKLAKFSSVLSKIDNVAIRVDKASSGGESIAHQKAATISFIPNDPFPVMLNAYRFQELTNNVHACVEFLRKSCNRPDVQSLFKEKTGENNKNASGVLFSMKCALAKDIFRTLEEFGYKIEINYNTSVGQALLCIVRILLPEEKSDFSYNDYKIAIEGSGQEVKKIRELTNESLSHYMDSEVNVHYPGADDFTLSIFFACFDDEYEKRYHELMRQLAVKLSALDEFHQGKKDSWLAKIDKNRIFWDNLYAEAGHASGVEALEESEKPSAFDDQKESSVFNDLNDLIGLSDTKKEIATLSNYIQMKQKRDEMGLKSPNISYHCVFTGNPGTGKTTVARLLAGIYRDLGVLKKGHLIETDRSGLVAEYVGQTAVKTNKIIDDALDGVLFIDEAYSLAKGGKSDYGPEAIATLLKRMEDDRDRLVVILAGYTNEIDEFINSNPGLRSRFNRYIHFADYTAEELYDIFCLMMKKNEYIMKEESCEVLKKYFVDVVSNKPKDFGNARYVRNMFERTIQNQANRLATEGNLTKDMLKEIKAEDWIC